MSVEWALLYKRTYLTLCGLVMPYGDIDLGQHWLRLWLVAWQHQAITWTNVDWSSVKSSDINIRAISQEMSQPSITKICLKITCLKFHSNFPGSNELTQLHGRNKKHDVNIRQDFTTVFLYIEQVDKGRHQSMSNYTPCTKKLYRVKKVSLLHSLLSKSMVKINSLALGWMCEILKMLQLHSNEFSWLEMFEFISLFSSTS